jgi:hypothetical protein
MFSRAFPEYVNYWLLQDVLEHQSLDRRWVNLYRETDPIAGPVLSWKHGRPSSTDEMTSCGFPPASATVPTTDLIVPETGRRVCGAPEAKARGCDWRLLDPTPAPNGDVDAESAAVAVIRAHSQFIADPDWDAAVEAVRAPWPGT